MAIVMNTKEKLQKLCEKYTCTTSGSITQLADRLLQLRISYLIKKDLEFISKYASKTPRNRKLLRLRM
jgi:hypothetical protein